MGSEAKNTINQTPEQIKQIKETAERTKINKAPVETVVKKLENTKLPGANDIKQEVRKETDLVKDKFSDLKYDNIQVIMVQYHLLGWDRNAGGAQWFDKLTLQDVYKLPATTKANIAYLSSMLNFKENGKKQETFDAISKSDYMIQNNLDSKTIEAKIDRISVWDRMTPQDLAFTKAFRVALEKIKHTEILSKYTNMFPAGQSVPPMPDIEQYAVWDGQNTTWIWWVRNWWRRLFEYGETGNLSINAKYIQYWIDKSNPMSISVLPSGADAKRNNTLNLIINDANWKRLWQITWRYSASWTANNMAWSKKWLDDILIENNTIIIHASYQNTNMSLVANSDYASAGKHDETNFSLSIENGRTVKPNEETPSAWSVSYDAKITDPMELGKFELTSQAKDTVNKIMDKSLFFGNKTMKNHIKMTLTVWVDETPFVKAGINTTILNYQKITTSQKDILVNQLKIFNPKQLEWILTNLQPDPSWKSNPDQYKAQKALIDCRFLTTVMQMTQNKDMVQAIKSGKFDIVANASYDGKYITLEPESMNYAKPLTVAK